MIRRTCCSASNISAAVERRAASPDAIATVGFRLANRIDHQKLRHIAARPITVDIRRVGGLARESQVVLVRPAR
jgi:hypothetical protein